MVAATDASAAPNKTILELNIKSGAGIDPLKDLPRPRRDELRTFSSLLATIAILGHWCWSLYNLRYLEQTKALKRVRFLFHNSVPEIGA